MDTAIASPHSQITFDDGLGQRLQVTGANNQPLTLLVFHRDLTAQPTFELALRERIEQLASFQHPSFARVRGLAQLPRTPGSIAVAFDRVSGMRLAEMLSVAEQRLIPLEIEGAYAMLRQLVRAVASFHTRGPAAFHGALAPERLILTGDGRIVVVEHVLGEALSQVPASYERYWTQYRIAVPIRGAVPQLDQRADVTQIGVLALALILGRPLSDHEYPDRISEIVAGVRAVSAHGAEELPPGMASWLRRALQLESDRSFATALEARDELDRVLGPEEMHEQQTLAGFIAQCRAALSEPGGLLSTIPVREMPEPSRPADTFRSFEVENAIEAATSQEFARPVIAPKLFEAATPAAPKPADPPKPFLTPSLIEASRPVEAMKAIEPAVSEAPKAMEPHKPIELPKAFEAARSVLPAKPAAAPAWQHDDEMAEEPSQPKTAWWQRKAIVAAAVVVVALGVGLTFGARQFLAAEPVLGTLTINTNPAGATVTIDGQRRGQTPLSAELAPGSHTLLLEKDGQVRTVPVNIAAGAQLAQFIEFPASPAIDPLAAVTTPLPTPPPLAPTPEPAASNLPVAGWISVNSPVDVQLFENGRLLGSSRSERIMVPVGRHEIEIVEDGLGFRATRTVQVTAGNVAAVRVEMPRGTMSLNALPWAEVWVDGERVGETPIGNVQVAIGTHEVLFRHPDLGEQVHRVVVTMKGPARVSADLRR